MKKRERIDQITNKYINQSKTTFDSKTRVDSKTRTSIDRQSPGMKLASDKQSPSVMKSRTSIDRNSTSKRNSIER
jgi:hypothetical protein